MMKHYIKNSIISTILLDRVGPSRHISSRLTFKAKEEITLREENLAAGIYFVRGEKVMMDFDLAMLYGVETAQLKRAVRRNIDRFPADFMFELTREHHPNLRCQTGISSWGGVRCLPFVVNT